MSHKNDSVKNSEKVFIRSRHIEISMKWISATGLDQWSRTRDSQETLPLIIRRLIRATCDRIIKIQFPAGDSVVYRGWDGILEVPEGNEYIPKGLSVWEISTRQDSRQKAEEDYQKRTKSHLDINPSEATFVFVTSRIWINKDEWCEEKRREGYWKDVRVYDARNLEEWLEQAPAVSSWLAKRLRIYPAGTESLEDFWERWSSITSPKLTPKLVLAGREQQVEIIRQWLVSDKSSIKAVQAQTSEEALAFLAAVIISLPEEIKESFLSRSLIIENSDSFKEITVIAKENLLLIPRFEEIEGTSLAVYKGHKVYIPLGPENKVTQKKIVLPRLGREAFISALKELGLSEEEAQKYSRDTARSLTVLRRHLLKDKAISQPNWAKPDTVRELIPALLAGKWSENIKFRDTEIVSQLAGQPYEKVSSNLKTWLNTSDPPLLKISDLWRLTSPLDAWFALAPYLTETDLQKLEKVFLEVLGNKNPALDLDIGKRWCASIYGKEPLYSGDLREGLAQTLILLALYGDKVNVPFTFTSQTYVDLIVRKLLKDADWKLWCSLTDILPLIAEASPQSFLDAVEQSLSKENSPILEMFSESEDPLFSPHYYTALLWALESLAWDPKLLSRTTLILAKLARLDPGGSLSNSPINSLRTIFLLWRPHTFATLKERLEVLDILLEQEFEIAWQLLLSLLPKVLDNCTPTHKPHWRKVSENQIRNVSLSERLHGFKAIVDKLLLHVNFDGNRWSQIIRELSSGIPYGSRQKIVKQLASSVDKIIEGRLELWNTLRKFLYKHRSCPDAVWALNDKELKEIEKIFLALEPTEILDRYSWLFDTYQPELPEGEYIKDIEKHSMKITERRIKAIKEIYKQEGLTGLIKFATKVKEAEILGNILTKIDINIEDNIYEFLDHANEKIVKLIQGYIAHSSIFKGKEWINKLVEKAKIYKWSLNKTLNLFLALPPNIEIWKLLETFDEEVQNLYWNKVPPPYYGIHREEIEYAIRKLLNQNRTFSALSLLAKSSWKVANLSADLVIEVLEKAATQPTHEEPVFDYYDIFRLFEILDTYSEINDDTLAKLEWLYLPILAQEGSSRSPKTLHKELASNPEFFTEVIKWAYKDGCEKEGLPEELIRRRARYAWELLETWRILPGSDQEGNVDYHKLKSWISKVRSLCREVNIIEIANEYIGQVLAYAKSEGEVWPPEPVCRVIEEFYDTHLEKGFIIGCFNKRGVHSKSPFEGGKQERELAQQYHQFADQYSIKYPKTAAIFKKIALDYENQAKIEDLEAERRDLEY